ncbi:hypothetical protein ACLOJK_016292 [Asimina triloba]
MAEPFPTGAEVSFPTGAVRLPLVRAGRASAIFLTIYMYIKEPINNFTLVVLVHSIRSTLAVILFYVHGVNVNAAATSKEIEKAEWWFDLKMTESMLAVQASLARMEALIAGRTFMSNHEPLLMNFVDKLSMASESVGLEAKLERMSKMIKMIQSNRGRNSAGMVQSGVRHDNDGAPSAHAVLIQGKDYDITPSG